jgi:hypothetical protein
MTVTSGSRSRPHRLLALSAAVATCLLSFGTNTLLAQPTPNPAPAGEAELDDDSDSEEEAEGGDDSHIKSPDTPIAGNTGNPGPAASPPPAPPGPGPAVIPDGEAPPGPVAPAFPPSIPNIDYGGRARIGFHTTDAADPAKMSDIAGDASVDIYFSGAIHRMVKWQFGVTGQYTGAAGSSNSSTGLPGRELGANAQLLDVLARFEFAPEFNIYAGRLIVIADRYTPSGPWGMDEWFYPGIFPNAPAAALMRSGPVGRDIGANVWGALFGGALKYYLGAYQFSDPNLSPLLSGRLQVSLLSGEPGFYQRTTYYGYKDLLSFGVGGQYQQNGEAVLAPPPMVMADPTMPAMPTMPVTPAVPATPAKPALLYDDYSYLTGDIIFEKVLGSAGTLSLVGSYAKFGGEYRAWDQHFLGSLGYLIPAVVGIGKLRPSVRFQAGNLKGVPGMSMVIDAQLGYVIMPWFARVAVGYRYSSTDTGKGAPVIGNMVFLGITVADP